MTAIIGQLAVSAGFDAAKELNSSLAYNLEALALRAADSLNRFSAWTFGITPDKPEVTKRIAVSARQNGFEHLRGIAMGINLCDPSKKTESTQALINTLRLAVENDINKVFGVVQDWPAGETGDFRGVILPTFVEVAGAALEEVPEIDEFGVENLIPPEQSDVNRLSRSNWMAESLNRELDREVAFAVPDLAHLYGMVPVQQWPDITDQLFSLIDAGRIPYAHLSIPELRTDRVIDAVEAGWVPADAIEALKLVNWVDLEAFDPNDPALGQLRELVKSFALADPSGWTQGLRFERLVAATELLVS